MKMFSFDRNDVKKNGQENQKYLSKIICNAIHIAADINERESN
jgi:hypothetical protein